MVTSAYLASRAKMTFSREAPPGAGRMSGIEAGNKSTKINKELRSRDSQTARTTEFFEKC